MRNKIKHWILCACQFLYDTNEVVKDFITVVFGLFGIGLGLIVYAPVCILYHFLMIALDFLYGVFDGFKKIRMKNEDRRSN